MDFFTEQDKAKDRSRRMWIYLIGLVLLISAALTVGIVWLSPKVFFYETHVQGLPLNWGRVAMIDLAIMGLILSVSFFEYLRIQNKGGSYIAESLGGVRLLEAESNQEKRLQNIVEEMALASGLPVPDVFVLKNQSTINAFACGTNLEKAAIGVSQGAIEHLTRDELQGVIAHEFSHIFHGDMQINAKLSGAVEGLLFIHLLGVRRSRRRYVRSRSQGSLSGSLVLLFWVLGFLGYVGAAIIKAAISRQREFLADATAVQYTRNPKGILMALQKIGAKGSSIDSEKSSKYSHMFFVTTPSWFGFMATHPPLGERIARLGGIPTEAYDQVSETGSEFASSHVHNFAGGMSHHETGPEIGLESQEATNVESASGAFLNGIGDLTGEGIRGARDFLDRIPAPIMGALHDPRMVTLILYSIGLSFQQNTREIQIAYLKKHLKSEVVDTILSYHETIRTFGLSALVPLIDLGIPALKQLNQEQKKQTLNSFIRLLYSKSQLQLLDYLLVKILEINLGQNYLPRPKSNQSLSIEQAKACVISALADQGSKNAEDYLQSYQTGVKLLKLRPKFMHQVFPWTLKDFDLSIRSLNRLRHSGRKEFIKVCLKVAKIDSNIDEMELVILRALCDCLGCPSPFIQPEVSAPLEANF